MSDGASGWIGAFLVLIAILAWGKVDLRQPTHVAQHSITRQ